MTKSGWRGGIRVTGLVLVLGLGAPLAAQPPAASATDVAPVVAAALPARLSDADFWKLTTDISEPGGYFRITDNYTSNEREVGQLMTMLREGGIGGGVYVGVGPEQNFSYIAAVRPAMAFIIDIRRQAAIQHLMFKAIFELSKDRADFISLLFSKPRPADLDESTPIQRIWDAYSRVDTDVAASVKTYERLRKHLVDTHKFGLNAEEILLLDSVYQAFIGFGPAISTRGSSMGGRGGGSGSTFADLTGWSYDATGTPQSFLSTEDNFRYVKGLHEKNLIVPVTGDFGGPKALRGIGEYLKKQGGVVRAYYVSNVEQYLFQDGKARAFYDNVATLPLDDKSVFIRPYSFRRGGGPMQSLCGIRGFLAAVAADRVYTNNDALACAYVR